MSWSGFLSLSRFFESECCLASVYVSVSLNMSMSVDLSFSVFYVSACILCFVDADWCCSLYAHVAIAMLLCALAFDVVVVARIVSVVVDAAGIVVVCHRARRPRAPGL